MQTQVPTNPKPTQTTGPITPTKGRGQKQQEVWPYSLRKRDLKLEVRSNEKTEKIVQMKEQGKNPQNQINKEEIGKLPEKEFRVMIVKMTPNL